MTDLLKQFCEGNVIVDCGHDREAYSEFMKQLDTETSLLWRGDCCKPSTPSFEVVRGRMIWAYRRDYGYNPNGRHALTYMNSPEAALIDNPKAIVVSVESMLGVTDELSPADDIELMSVLSW